MNTGDKLREEITKALFERGYLEDEINEWIVHIE